jgi:hypothetical protein
VNFNQKFVVNQKFEPYNPWNLTIKSKIIIFPILSDISRSGLYWNNISDIKSTNNKNLFIVWNIELIFPKTILWTEFNSLKILLKITHRLIIVWKTFFQIRIVILVKKRFLDKMKRSLNTKLKILETYKRDAIFVFEK